MTTEYQLDPRFSDPDFARFAAIYIRFGQPSKEQFPKYEQAMGFLENGQEHNQFYPLGIVDQLNASTSVVVYCHQGMIPPTFTPEEVMAVYEKAV